ncbi:hypothetical protein ACFSQQ_16415 [Mesorhizobium kowhaii]|uniref:hypothetical protein n=1 Tax=Mesorhizobium kowhaii TaxID=1300272 RepID=UPI0035ED4037
MSLLHPSISLWLKATPDVQRHVLEEAEKPRGRKPVGAPTTKKQVRAAQPNLMDLASGIDRDAASIAAARCDKGVPS